VGNVLYLLVLAKGFNGRGVFARKVTIKLWPCQTHTWISENEAQKTVRNPTTTANCTPSPIFLGPEYKLWEPELQVTHHHHHQ